MSGADDNAGARHSPCSSSGGQATHVDEIFDNHPSAKEAYADQDVGHEAPVGSKRRNAAAVTSAELIDTRLNVLVPASRWAMYSRSTTGDGVSLGTLAT